MPLSLSAFCADPSLGRIGKTALSQETLMELFFNGITTTACFLDRSDDISDITQWL